MARGPAVAGQAGRTGFWLPLAVSSSLTRSQKSSPVRGSLDGPGRAASPRARAVRSPGEGSRNASACCPAAACSRPAVPPAPGPAVSPAPGPAVPPGRGQPTRPPPGHGRGLARGPGLRGPPARPCPPRGHGPGRGPGARGPPTPPPGRAPADPGPGRRADGLARNPLVRALPPRGHPSHGWLASRSPACRAAVPPSRPGRSRSVLVQSPRAGSRGVGACAARSRGAGSAPEADLAERPRPAA